MRERKLDQLNPASNSRGSSLTGSELLEKRRACRGALFSFKLPCGETPTPFGSTIGLETPDAKKTWGKKKILAPST